MCHTYVRSYTLLCVWERGREGGKENTHRSIIDSMGLVLTYGVHTDNVFVVDVETLDMIS